jgi:hypothetical protein
MYNDTRAETSHNEELHNLYSSLNTIRLLIVKDIMDETHQENEKMRQRVQGC